MDQYHEDNNLAYEQPEAVPSQRPPQFNERNCGCRCGHRCGGPCEEDDDGRRGRRGERAGTEARGVREGESDSETLVDSDSDVEGNPEYRGDGNDIQMIRPVHSSGSSPLARVHSRSTLPIVGSHIVRIRLHAASRAQSSARSQSSYGLYDTSGSMEPEPYGTESHSPAVSRVGSVHVISPGPDFERFGMDEIELVYHFLIEPLRLSPQYQDCRGKMASHLVIRDDISFMDDD
ncbi:hypothetical protein P153DRAFT_174141 [Dothidotthia symphoricarpi CBS 119687]|uniref:Uncharacterized protein n=1 Tax=Dothidotthia symphoricarpi CBS 119687 TaxID=1392245 RepID=A0A6A6ALF5_9PLEO|nr:uncharacterized protein P153DRAFT_174141 [Dothidotthia symphoricarpi CBS 119687]KAF2132812.1 hypothetical protein P153DRAFT_174141 [Dothidotthia symphoricarpi CBS 119687]